MEFAYELVNVNFKVCPSDLAFCHSISVFELNMLVYLHMPTQSFSDSLVMYFNNILNVTMFIQYFLFSVALVVLVLPKKIDKRAILWSLLRFALLYVAYVFGESIFFALSNMAGRTAGGLLFTASFMIFPIVFLIPTVKDYPLHKIIKSVLMVASLMVTAEIGRLLGMLIETPNPNDIVPAVVILRCLPLLFLPFIAFIMYKFNITRFKHLPLPHVVMILVLSALMIASAIWQNGLEIDDNSSRWLLIFVASVELGVLVGLYYSIYSLIDYRHRVTELEVRSTVLSLKKESLEIDAKNREELMKIRHDLQNQLSYTQALLNDGKYDEANNYIQSLVNQKEEYLYSFSCSNIVVAGIVNLELTKAKIANKKIKFKVVVPPKLPFEDSDLLSLITNIVDNSIENFNPVDTKDVINVSIVTQQDYLRITSFNSVDPSLTKEKPSLRTTKKNRGHGYGTKIIKNITKKYEGYVTFTFEDNKFVCDCMINMNHKGVNNA